MAKNVADRVFIFIIKIQKNGLYLGAQTKAWKIRHCVTLEKHGIQKLHLIASYCLLLENFVMLYLW